MQEAWENSPSLPNYGFGKKISKEKKYSEIQEHRIGYTNFSISYDLKLNVIYSVNEKKASWNSTEWTIQTVNMVVATAVYKSQQKKWKFSRYQQPPKPVDFLFPIISR